MDRPAPSSRRAPWWAWFSAVVAPAMVLLALGPNLSRPPMYIPGWLLAARVIASPVWTYLWAMAFATVWQAGSRGPLGLTWAIGWRWVAMLVVAALVVPVSAGAQLGLWRIVLSVRAWFE